MIKVSRIKIDIDILIIYICFVFNKKKSIINLINKYLFSITKILLIYYYKKYI